MTSDAPVLHSFQQLKRNAAKNVAPSGFRVVIRGEQGYDDAREISNSRFDFKPRAIAFPRAAEHVAQCVRFCRENDYELRIRSGGHQHEGLCSGHDVLMVRLSKMNTIQFSEDMQTAWIGVGCRLQDVYQELANYGKIIAGGGCKSVNVGGLTLGGGWGLSARKFGLACDNVLALEVVLAMDDESTGDKLATLKTIEKKNNDPKYDDLFWALLGSGGGNFGIVTGFKFRLHDIDPCLSKYKVYWQAQNREEVIKRWLSFQRHDQSRDTTSYLVLYADSKDDNDRARTSRYSVYAGGLSYREPELLRAEVSKLTHGLYPVKEEYAAPLRHKLLTAGPGPSEQGLSLGDFLNYADLPTDLTGQFETMASGSETPSEPAATECRVPFPKDNCIGPHPHKVSSAFPSDQGRRYESRLAQALSKFLEEHPVSPSVKCYISLYSMGGAIADLQPKESAFWYRRKPFLIQIESWWNYPESKTGTCRDKTSWQQPYIDWVRNFRNALQDEGLIEGAFINFVDNGIELSEYYGGNFERLQRSKTTWDPSGFFKFTGSIPSHSEKG